jgi:tRNA threonylcarbamoyladenosine biosynthesis protein TsaB
MKILSIDTASNICAVAVLEDDKLIEEKILKDTKTHSEKIMPTILEVLHKTNLTLKDFDLIVCDKGPGSFTGIRIGVATVLAFQDALKIKAIGISSLEVLAHTIKTDGLICSLIDARNSNAYFGLFKLENNEYSLLEEMKAENIDNILKDQLPLLEMVLLHIKIVF